MPLCVWGGAHRHPGHRNHGTGHPGHGRFNLLTGSGLKAGTAIAFTNGGDTFSIENSTDTIQTEITGLVETYNSLLTEIDENDDYDWERTPPKAWPTPSTKALGTMPCQTGISTVKSMPWTPKSIGWKAITSGRPTAWTKNTKSSPGSTRPWTLTWPK